MSEDYYTDEKLQELLDRWREQRIQSSLLSPYQQCENFYEAPDDDRPTQQWYPISHGTACPGHRIWIRWTDQPYYDVSPKYEPYTPGYNIKLAEEWKDAF